MDRTEALAEYFVSFEAKQENIIKSSKSTDLSRNEHRHDDKRVQKEFLSRASPILVKISTFTPIVSEFRDLMKDINFDSTANSVEKEIEIEIAESALLIRNLEAMLTEIRRKTLAYSNDDMIAFQSSVMEYLNEMQIKISQDFRQLQMKLMKQLVLSNSNLTNMLQTKRNNIQYEEDEKDESVDSDLDEDMRLELELENQMLKSELDSYLSVTSQVEQQVQEVSQLLSLFNSKLFEQRQYINQINDDAEKATHQMIQGNEQLKRTDERATNDIQLFIAYMLATLLILIYDY